MAGPTIPLEMYLPCAVVISDVSFLAISWNDIREYMVNKEQPTSQSGWQQANKWPQLQTIRYGWHGCSKIDGKVVIAGGFNGIGNGEYLRSTEVLDVATRMIEYGEDLTTPRESFHIVTIRRQGIERALAVGGYDGSSSLDSVEEFDPDTLTWNPVEANLLERKSSFGATALPQKLICPV